MARASIIGFDLGGTKIGVARYDRETWKIQRQETIPTHATDGFRHVLDDVVRLAKLFLEGKKDEP